MITPPDNSGEDAEATFSGSGLSKTGIGSYTLGAADPAGPAEDADTVTAAEVAADPALPSSQAPTSAAEATPVETAAAQTTSAEVITAITPGESLTATVAAARDLLTAEMDFICPSSEIGIAGITANGGIAETGHHARRLASAAFGLDGLSDLDMVTPDVLPRCAALAGPRHHIRSGPGSYISASYIKVTSKAAVTTLSVAAAPSGLAVVINTLHGFGDSSLSISHDEESLRSEQARASGRTALANPGEG
ncbi:MAG: hypothetical protein JO264_02190 [Acidisphaera sp.]|nr:hypothetical protein [Acidisphaera sp.]